MGIGVIIRDCKGPSSSFNFGKKKKKKKKISLPPLVAELEALAALRALKFAQDLGFRSIVLEGYSEVVIKAL